MPSELKISITLPVPEDIMEQAESIALLRPSIEAFKIGIVSASPDASFAYEVVAPKVSKPRQPRAGSGSRSPAETSEAAFRAGQAPPNGAAKHAGKAA